MQADINQSEVEDSFQLASDWIKSARKNVNKLKRSHLGSLSSASIETLASVPKVSPDGSVHRNTLYWESSYKGRLI